MKNSSIRQSVLYEIYPTSFYDSDGDGIGDLNGITEKLDYVAQFADLVWLNPFYVSPFFDGGYDVADYLNPDPRFGTKEDFVRLLNEANRRGIRVLVDLVVGHTSDRHPWFLASKRAERNAYSDYYIWTDDTFSACPYPVVRGNSERNGGYLTNFFFCQPALNFGFAEKKYDWQMRYDDERLLPLREEIVSIMKHYLGLGVAGFRADMAFSLVKEDPDRLCTAKVWAQMIESVRKEFPEAIFLSEWGEPAIAVGKAKFDMDFLTHDFSDGYTDLFRKESGANVLKTSGYSFFRKEGRGDVETFLRYFTENERKIRTEGYICVPSGNHDLPRLALGRDEDDLIVAMAFLFALPAIPMIYYGDEIGMRQLNCRTKDGGYIRTGARTPMQWSAEENAGFSRAEPQRLYLPVDEEYRQRNADRQSLRNDSLLHFVRKLCCLRRTESLLAADGDYALIRQKEILRLERFDERERLICLFNPRNQSVRVECAGELALSHRVVSDRNILTMQGCSFAYVKQKR